VIATVLRPGERSRVEAAGNGCFEVLHRDSVSDAIRIVRERAVDAILLSVHRCEERQVKVVGHLVRDFPGISTVALVSEHNSDASEKLLHLGATGVRHVVDVSAPGGWRQLRQLVGQPTSRAVARIQGPVLSSLGAPTPDARLFFEVLIRLAPEVGTVRRLCRRLQVRPSTLMSRFSRAGLPSPKGFLASVRLLHAAFLFESPGLSVADVVYRLEYSSPQSFGRHVRSSLGITATEFRARFPFTKALERFVAHMILPHRSVWRAFHPLTPEAVPPRPDLRPG
jgi:AraC-like DNA-binding protein